MIRAALAFALLLLPATVQVASAAYPDRPITLIVPSQTGDGADAMARLVGSLLVRELGQPVNVRNRPDGGGSDGHEAIAQATPDGYTIGLVTTEVAMLHWQDRTAVTPADLTPLALLNRDPAALFVRADGKVDDGRELLDAIIGKGRVLRAGGPRDGGIWHLALAGFLESRGLPPDAVRWQVTEGLALQSLAEGEVDLVPAAVSEASALLNAGLVRGVAVMDDQRNAGFPAIPTLAEATGSPWTAAAWRGIAGPKGLPPDVSARLEDALDRVYRSPEFRDFMGQRGFGMAWQSGDDFAAFMARSNTDLGRALGMLGFAKRTAVTP